MIGWLTGFGISRRAAIGILGLLGVLIILAAFYLALNAYGNARYKQGKADADNAWIAASNKLIKKAADAGSKASVAQAARDADFAARQEEEKERIAHAQATGASPMDVLFGNAS